MFKVQFHSKAEWLKAREKCLTGTKLREYLGFENVYKNQSQADLEKSPAVNFGINCETSVLTIFKNLPEISKQTLVIPTITPTLWYSDIDKRLAGSFDSLAWENEQEGFCECKTTSANLYDLRQNIIPDTTWLQILHYFAINDNFKFCYLVVCSYPKWGNYPVKIEWKKILRSDVQDRINKIKMWHKYLLDGNII